MPLGVADKQTKGAELIDFHMRIHAFKIFWPIIED